MRKTLLVFILIVSTLSLKAQNNYFDYSIGINASTTYPYADLKQGDNKRAYSIAGYYNLTPFIPLGLEVQIGQLSGGNTLTDPSNRQYDNHYTAFVLHGDAFLGQIIDYSYGGFMNIVKDFYVGTGVGVISNNMAFIQRTNITGPNAGTYTFPGADRSINLMVPLRIGYEYRVYNTYGDNFMSINIGYIHNITFGEGLDGYKDSSKDFKNNSPDQYRQIVVGLKVNFGPSSAY